MAEIKHATDTTFEQIWNSPGFQDLRERHARQALGEQFSACKWCYKQRYVDFEHLPHPTQSQHIVSTATRTRLWAEAADPTGCAAACPRGVAVGIDGPGR